MRQEHNRPRHHVQRFTKSQYIKNCLTPLGLVEMYLEDLIEVYTGEDGQKKRSGVEDLSKSFEVMDIVKNNFITMIN